MNDNITTTTGEAGTDVTPQQEGQKTFSQDELNKIVSERLQRERQKSESVLADRERELAQRELQLTAKEKITALGWPPELADALNMSSPEALETSLALMQKALSKINTQPVEIKGAKPAGASPVPAGGGGADIRRAMGLT